MDRLVPTRASVWAHLLARRARRQAAYDRAKRPVERAPSDGERTASMERWDALVHDVPDADRQ